MAEKFKDEAVTEEVTKTEEKACKKNGKKVLIAVIACVAVAVLAVGGFFVYRIFRNNDPVKVTSDAIRGLKDNIKDAKDENPGLTKLLEGNDPYEVNTSIKVTLPQKMGTLGANILAQIDAKNEMFRADVNAKFNKELLFDMSAILDSKNLAFKFPDTMKNYYSVDISEAMSEFKESMKEIDTKAFEKAMKYDYTKLIDYLADAIEDALDKGDFKKTNDEISVDGKDIKVNKYTAKITAKEATKVASSFLTKVSKDSELIDVFATLTDTDKKDIKEFLNDTIKELKDVDVDGDEYILYSVYVSKTGKVVGYGFEFEGVEVTIATRNDVTEIKATASGVTISLTIEEKSDDHVVITLSTVGISATLDIKDEVKTVKKNSEYKEELSIELKISVMGQDDVTAKIEAESTIKKIDSVTKAKDAKDIEKLTAAEQATLQKEVEGSAAYKTIMALTKSMEKNPYLTQASKEVPHYNY